MPCVQPLLLHAVADAITDMAYLRMASDEEEADGEAPPPLPLPLVAPGEHAAVYEDTGVLGMLLRLMSGQARAAPGQPNQAWAVHACTHARRCVLGLGRIWLESVGEKTIPRQIATAHEPACRRMPISSVLCCAVPHGSGSCRIQCCTTCRASHASSSCPTSNFMCPCTRPPCLASVD